MLCIFSAIYYEDTTLQTALVSILLGIKYTSYLQPITTNVVTPKIKQEVQIITGAWK
jgi:hypothetical protein